MGKKKKILLLSGLLLLLLAGAVGAYFGFMKREPVVEEITSELYWNVDRDQYIPELGGNTIRKPEDDGLWTVRFLVGGELVEYRVADKDVMIEVDAVSALGLEIDEDGIITGVIDIRDLGYREVAKSFYVQTMDEKTVVANSSFTGSEVDVSLKLNDETCIYNVTGLVEPIGVKDDLQLMDCIRAFNNEEGKITDIFIVEREEILNGVSPDRYCEHCDQVVTWRMWLASTALPYASGHFRLIKDVELKEQYSMAADSDIVLDLNGKTVSRKTEGRVMSLHGKNVTLSIVDGSEEQTGMIKGHGECTASGAVVWVRYGTLNLYKGTINASEVTNLGANGAAMQVNKNATFNMYGGTIIGGMAKAALLKNEETGKESLSGGMGGAIYCLGTINMYDGEILDGKVASCKGKNGKMASIAGGNIALGGSSVLNLYGGKISGGKVTDPNGHGGNISVRNEKATLNMSGGTVTKGVSMLQGGNIASWGTINMSGGVVKGGKNMTGDSLKGATYNETSTSHNMFLVSSTFNMSGGTIEGYVGATKGVKDKAGNYVDCKVKLSGTARICGAEKNLTMGSNMIQFGKLTGNAKISVNGSGFISTETIESNTKYVQSDYEGAGVIYHEKRLFVGKLSCVCGGNQNGEHFGACDGTLLAWKPWTKDTTAPTKEGNWYLLSDIQLKGITEPQENATLLVDLNGKTITGRADRRVYSTVNGNVNLTITDLSDDKSGRIVAQTGEQPERLGKGGCVWAYKKSNVTFYGGCLDATKATSPANGVAVSVESGCSFTMYGGTIKGGKAIKEATPNKNGNYQQGYAGSVYVIGKFDMQGGVIQGGFAEQYGGNIYVASKGDFDLRSGEILLGKADTYGGNISGTGSINITGGIVARGKASYGGNICVRKNMTMTSGAIQDGTANGGGNIYVSDSAKMTVSGGTISGGEATTENGGNLRIWTNSELNIANAVIKNGVAAKDGGNIYLNDKAKLTMTDAIVSGGKALAKGGNISIGKGTSKTYTKVSISGGEIRDGYAKKIGGNVYVLKGDVTLSGAVSILDGTTAGQGGTKVASNLYLEKGVTVALNGLTSTAASIGVSSVDSTFATNANANQSDLTRFVSDGGHPIAQSSKNELFIGKLSCMCGGYQEAVDVVASGDGKHASWCTEDMHDVEWHAWRSSTTLPGDAKEGIHYYLTSDVELESALRLETEGVWGLDLNGKDVTYSKRACNIGKNGVATKYYITDTSAGRVGSFAYYSDTISAGKTIDGMLFFVQGAAEVHFYAGTIDATGVTGTYAPALVVSKGTFVMHGGAVLPGISAKTPAIGNYATNCVEVRQGTLDVQGGIIEGEVRLTTSSAVLKLNGSPKVGVAVANDATKNYGIFALSRTTDEEVIGNVQCENVNVFGGIVLKSTADIALSGTGEGNSFVITDALEGKYNQIVDDNPNDLGNLSLGAKIRSCGDVNCNGTSTTHTCELPATAWKPWNAEQSKAVSSGKVNLPNGSQVGAYYLTEDLSMDNVTEVGGSNERRFYLDLNGHTATNLKGRTGKASKIFHISNTAAKYFITDTVGGGSICFEKDYEGVQYGALITNSGEITLYAGTLDMTNITGEYGRYITLSAGSMNVYGGTIRPAGNNEAPNCIGVRGSSVLTIKGGNVYGEVELQNSKATLNLSGAPVVGAREKTDSKYSYGIFTSKEDAKIVCTDVAANAVIKLKDNPEKTSDDFILSGTGEGCAFEIINNKYNQIVDDNTNGIGNLSLGAKLRSCGDVNCNGQSTTHTCELPSTAWNPWNTALSKAKGSGSDGAAKNKVTLPDGNAGSGAYYLTENMTLDYQSYIGGNKNICIDLNGYTAQRAKNSDTRVFEIRAANSKLSITDSKGGGKICFADGYGNGTNGEMIYLNHTKKTGEVNMYAGTLDCSQITSGRNPFVLIGNMNVYEGTIKPATSVDDTRINCIIIDTGCTLTVKGGAIFGEIKVNGSLIISGSPIVGAKEKTTDTYVNGIFGEGTVDTKNASSNAQIAYK